MVVEKGPSIVVAGLFGGRRRECQGRVVSLITLGKFRIYSDKGDEFWEFKVYLSVSSIFCFRNDTGEITEGSRGRKMEE